MDELARRTVKILAICVGAGVIAGALALGEGASPELAALAAGVTCLTLLALIFLMMWRP